MPTIDRRRTTPHAAARSLSEPTARPRAWASGTQARREEEAMCLHRGRRTTPHAAARPRALRVRAARGVCVVRVGVDALGDDGV